MATTVFRLFAALAAVLLGGSLVACGGGEDFSFQSKQDQVAAVAFSGSVVDRGTTFNGQLRVRALSVSATKTVPAKFAITSTVIPVSAGASMAPKLTAQAVVDGASVTDDQTFDWAEKQYAELFPTHETTSTVVAGDGNTYRYRYYPMTGNYVGRRVGGSDDGGIYVMGAFTGNQVLRVGHMRGYTCVVDPNVCAPKVASINLVSMTTGQVVASVLSGKPTVHAKTKAVFRWNQRINCTGIGGDTELGDDFKVPVTISCDSVAGTITVTPKENMLYGVEVTMTLSNVTSLDGFVSVPVTANFTTRPPEVSGLKLFLANNVVEPDRITSVVEGSTVSTIGFPPMPGFLGMRYAAVDPLMGKVYFGGYYTFAIYEMDIESNQVVGKQVDQELNLIHGVRGIALSEGERCIVYDVSEDLTYARKNQLECYGRTTGRVTFSGTRNFLGTDTQTPTQLRYLPYGTDKKFYALVADGAAWFYEGVEGDIREGYKSGTRGSVVEIDAVTHTKRTFAVGSVPQGIDRNLTTGELLVVNAGDKSLTIINPMTGARDTKALEGFTGYQRPMRIKIVDNRFFVTDDIGAIMVYDLATKSLVAQVPLSSGSPSDIAFFGGQLYVSTKNRFTLGTSALYTINPSTFAVRKVVGSPLYNPYALVGYVPAPKP